MTHGTFLRGIAAFCLLALPQMGAAEGLQSWPCEKGRIDSFPVGSTTCRVTVPNGDFAGAEAPFGDESWRYSHPWDSGFSWTAITPRVDHAIDAHLKPWTFHGEGTPAYPDRRYYMPGVVLAKPGDAIFQWVPLPPVKPVDGRKTTYIVQVTYAAYNARGKVGLMLKVIGADASTEQMSEVFEDAKEGTPSEPATFVVSVDVPTDKLVTQLGVAVGKADDSTPLLIKDVVVVEMTQPDITLDF